MTLTGAEEAAALTTTTSDTPTHKQTHALLSCTDLRELGLERRAAAAGFRSVPIVVLPGYRRPLVRVRDYLELLARSAYDGSRVR